MTSVNQLLGLRNGPLIYDDEADDVDNFVDGEAELDVDDLLDLFGDDSFDDDDLSTDPEIYAAENDVSSEPMAVSGVTTFMPTIVVETPVEPVVEMPVVEELTVTVELPDTPVDVAPEVSDDVEEPTVADALIDVFLSDWSIFDDATDQSVDSEVVPEDAVAVLLDIPDVEMPDFATVDEEPMESPIGLRTARKSGNDAFDFVLRMFSLRAEGLSTGKIAKAMDLPKTSNVTVVLRGGSYSNLSGMNQRIIATPEQAASVVVRMSIERDAK